MLQNRQLNYHNPLSRWNEMPKSNQSQFLKRSWFNSGSIPIQLSNSTVSQSVWISQNYTQLSQILGFRFQISPFSPSPKTQNMQEFDHDDKYLEIDKRDQQTQKCQNYTRSGN